MTLFEEPDFLFKILLVGNSAVGKSSLLQSGTAKHFEGTFNPTIGVDFKIQSFQVDGKLVKLQIWDTAGQERFRSICRSYYRGAHGVILVYDVTERTSFNDIETWLEDIEKIAGDRGQRILVGNKADLEGQRVISYDEGKQLANQLGMKFLETSAKMAWNVQETFETLAREIRNHVEKGSRPKDKIEIISSGSSQQNSSWCCSYL